MLFALRVSSKPDYRLDEILVVSLVRVIRHSGCEVKVRPQYFLESRLFKQWEKKIYRARVLERQIASRMGTHAERKAQFSQTHRIV